VIKKNPPKGADAMSSDHCLVEKRRYKRYRAKENAIVEPESKSGSPGQIIDIGLDGLSYQYLPNGKPTKDSFTLDIIVTRNGFHLKKIPVKKISDFYLFHNEALLNLVMMRRASVQYANLTKEKRSKLEHFIQHYTNGEA
jgi:hypothetical protein